MKRSRKRIRKNRTGRNLLIIIFLLVGLVAYFAPTLQHLNNYNSALKDYDFQTVAEELTWIEKKASWLKLLPFVEDGELWLKLNLGEGQSIESQLKESDKESHKLWLFQYYSSQGELEKAQAVSQSLQSLGLKRLSEGLLLIQEGKYDEGAAILYTIGNSDLDTEEYIFLQIALARSEMALGNLAKAQRTWQLAEEKAPLHPLVKATEVDLALVTGQWSLAQEKIEELRPLQEDSPYTTYLLVKKALLSLVLGEKENFQNTLGKLEGLPHGEGCQLYLKGIEAYGNEDFPQAVEYLESALEKEMPKYLMRDAEVALSQASERVQASEEIQRITGSR